jgi:zinc-ribbon domain
VCQTEVVPEYCTCGAQLPPDARFCHKCGKPQYDYMPAVEEAEPEPAPPQPVVAEPQPLRVPTDISFHNGLAVRIGFIAAMGAVMISLFPIPWPFVRLPIAFLAAGFLAVFLYSRRTGQTLSIRSGARIGWITGIFSFTLVTVLFTVATVAVSTQGGFAQQIRSQFPANDARAEMIQQVFSNPAMIAGVIVLYLMLFFVIFTALPTIGGALGAKVLEKQ